jgi:hypothetical protein
MAEHMKQILTPGGAAQDYPMGANNVGDIIITNAYGQGLTMTWTEGRPQQTSITNLIDTFIIYWDESYNDPDGNPFSESNPIFEGYIRSVQPSESNKITLTAMDPTHKVGHEVTVMSSAWEDGSPPTPGPGSYPRLVFNSTIDNDDDYAFEREAHQTVGQIVQILLEDAASVLTWFDAADSATPYNAAELTAMDFEPQEKVVFETETITAAIQRIVERWHPARRLNWIPGTREWRFPDITAATARTVTLNLFDAQTPGLSEVLAMDLDRSIEGRYTAVKYYGPESVEKVEFSTDNGLLSIVESNHYLQNDLDTCCNVRGVNKFRIAGLTSGSGSGRRLTKLLPEEIAVPVLVAEWASTAGASDTLQFIQWVMTRGPSLQVKYPDTSAGFSQWVSVTGWRIDLKTGEITLGQDGDGNPLFVTRYNPSPAGGSPNWENPIAAKFICGQYGDAIVARYPTTGYAGTAFTVAGIEAELAEYDEMLAIGFDRGQAVTSAARLAAFTNLAQKRHAQLSDIVYTGGITLDGLNFDYCRLNRRVNIDAIDANGGNVATGWESIGAFVTSVEFDIENKLTTLQFSTDQAELIGIDIEAQKRALKIRALNPVYIPHYRIEFATRRAYTEFGTPILGQDVTVVAAIERRFVDPVTGESEA